jgi:FkbM family methyltransferase
MDYSRAADHTQRLQELLGPRMGALTFVDVGAHSVEGQEEVYKPGLAAPEAVVIGFEANGDECTRLNLHADRGRRYFPCAIGDGRPGRFFHCSYPLTSSLLRPNTPLLQRYENLAELCEVVGESAMETRRLDDIEDLDDADFLKLDAQGAAYPVLRGATRLLDRVLVIHTEVEFVPIYEGEALFSEVELLLRGRGFMFHHFHQMEGRRIRAGKYVVGLCPRQMLWADAVFVPGFERLECLHANKLLRLAWLMDTVYQAHDTAMLCLNRYDTLAGERFAHQYWELLKQAGLLL